MILLFVTLFKNRHARFIKLVISWLVNKRHERELLNRLHNYVPVHASGKYMHSTQIKNKALSKKQQTSC